MKSIPLLPATFLLAACSAAPAGDASHAVAPRINPPRVFGVRPGAPFLFRVPVSGTRPLRIRAEGLPKGLALDPATGIVTGSIVSTEKTTYRVAFSAENAGGADKGVLRIVVGDRIALTPPMGWNSWYVWSESVSDKRMRDAADLFEKSGLADFGWAYVNCDDCWQGVRGGPDLALQGNEKFPDMAALAGHIHAKGLKFGLYTVPMAGSYAGFAGSSCLNAEGTYAGLSPDKRLQPGQVFGRYPGHQRFGADKIGPHWLLDRDAKRMAGWGVDLLKVDWPIDPDTALRVSRDMRAQKRDIVLSLSNNAPIKGAKTYAECAEMWRTTGDINDTWKSVSGIGFNQGAWGAFGGPGHWNDPDMLQVGWTNEANQLVTKSRPSRLTFEEQKSQVALWSLLSAPLILSCDLAKLDDATLSLLTNPEVLEVDQDPLGKPAEELRRQGDLRLWRKRMEDGSMVVGVFNTGAAKASATLSGAMLGLSAGVRLRDLWARTDLPAGDPAVELPAHGCVLLRTE